MKIISGNFYSTLINDYFIYLFIIAGIDETYGIPVQFDNVDDDDDAEDVYGEVKERGDVSDDDEEDDDDDEVVMAEDTGIHGVSNIAGNRDTLSKQAKLQRRFFEVFWGRI